jgi:hypothetical protein
MSEERDAMEAFMAWLNGPHANNWNDSNHRLTVSEEISALKGWKAALEWQASRQSTDANESTLRVLPSYAIRKHEGVTIFGDPAQVLKVMAAIEGAEAVGQSDTEGLPICSIDCRKVCEFCKDMEAIDMIDAVETSPGGAMERAILAAGRWTNSNKPISETLAYRDGFMAGEKAAIESIPERSVECEQRERFEKVWDMERGRVQSGRHDVKTACWHMYQAASTSANVAQGADAAGPEPVGVIECDEVNGWHMKALVDWEKIGLGTKLYAATIGDNREKAGKPVCPHCGLPDIEYSRTCHNSACSAYARAESFYEGWKDAAPIESQAESKLVELTDAEIDAVYDSVPWKELNVASLEHAMILRPRFGVCGITCGNSHD